ncbi:hypothetical protein AC579_9358 [Pseudocercospora musae]|uniref:Uncharacterized protein n=1 Tax=Pseudocercospora musae TaxID=113226 RepID=A0A139I2J9_9PEZI|nr:hypothetical protein AC579_9358 [Pseudocercospora musae]
MERIASSFAAALQEMYSLSVQLIRLLLNPFTSITSIMDPASMPWNILKDWSPFQLDALGLVTLLGAEEVNKAVGTLQKRKATECFPLLAANVIAGDRIRDEQAGFAIYNVTDGICTTELKGWFTRWLGSQKIRNATTTFRWRFEDTSKQQTLAFITNALSFLLTTAPLLVCTTVIGDWYGLAGTIAIIVTIASRKIVLWQLRNGLEAVANPVKPPHDLPFSRQDANKQQAGSDAKQIDQNSAPGAPQDVKLFITRSDGRMVTVYAPRSLLSSFVREAEIPHQHVYHVTRWLSWAAFGVLLVTLGMSSLFTQIYIVALLVLCTWAFCHGFDFDLNTRRKTRPHLGTGREAEVATTSLTSKIAITQKNPSKRDLSDRLVDKRMYAYIWADLTATEEDMLRHWSMLPFSGVEWYKDFNRAKDEYAKACSMMDVVHNPGSTSPSILKSTTSEA